MANRYRVRSIFQHVLVTGIFAAALFPGSCLAAGASPVTRFRPHSSQQNNPVFEVASVKPHQPDGMVNASLIACRGIDSPAESGGVLRFEGAAAIDVLTAAERSRQPAPGRCILSNISLKGIIDWAYEFDVIPGKLDDKITGGPGWAATERFDIEAKAENASAKVSQLKQMMRSLLSDRFGLKFHRETREILGFALFTANGGPKLNASSGEERRDSSSRDREGTMRWTGTNLTAPDIARSLWRFLGRPVVDRTQLHGSYDLTLIWTDDALATSGSSASTSASGPSLVTAIQEQLGLRIESQNVPFEIIVIDSAEKPDNRN